MSKLKLVDISWDFSCFELWRPGCNGNSFNNSCIFCWLSCRGSGVSWFNSMCVSAKGKHNLQLLLQLFGIWCSEAVVWKLWCFHVFSSMEATDHPVWVMEWSWSSGVYSAFWGPSKTWTMMTVGSWIPTRSAQGDFAGPSGDTLGGTWLKNGFSIDVSWLCRISIHTFSADFSLFSLKLVIAQTSKSLLPSALLQAMNLLTHFGCITSGRLGMWSFWSCALPSLHRCLAVLLRNAVGEETPCPGHPGSVADWPSPVTKQIIMFSAESPENLSEFPYLLHFATAPHAFVLVLDVLPGHCEPVLVGCRGAPLVLR